MLSWSGRPKPRTGTGTGPSNLNAELADGQVTLNWDAPAQDAASVTGYEILRRRPRQGEETLTIFVADTGSTATTHVDGTANEPGQRYVYRVKALRGEEKSRWSNYARIDLPGQAGEPEPTSEPTPAPARILLQHCYTHCPSRYFSVRHQGLP